MRNYASFWRRFAGFFIDSLLLGAVFGCVGQVMLANAPVWLASLVWIGPWVYIVTLTAAGATLGQRAVAIKVIDEFGAIPGYFRAFKRALLPAALTLLPTWLIDVLLDTDDDNLLRALGYSSFVLLIAASISLLDYCWMIWDIRKQTLHDKIAATFVVSS